MRLQLKRYEMVFRVSFLSNDDPLFVYPGPSSYLESISDECRLLRYDSAFLSRRLALPDLLDYLS